VFCFFQTKAQRKKTSEKSTCFPAFLLSSHLKEKIVAKNPCKHFQEKTFPKRAHNRKKCEGRVTSHTLKKNEKASISGT
jgi:hypothetical protein